MMEQTLTRELEVAVDAVRQASQVCRQVQANLVTADTLEKKDRSPVTVADFASQAVVCAGLAGVFPDDPVVGEEGSAALRGDDNATMRAAVTQHVQSVLADATPNDVLEWIDRGGASGDTPRYWTLDPIDGTKGFLRGEQYAVALALIEEGQVVLGVLGCPNLPMGDEPGALIVAVRGEGAWMLSLDGQGTDGQAIGVTDVADPSTARFCESVESGHSDQGAAAQIANTLGIANDPVRMDSQVKYAAVARGDAEIYLRLPTRADYREKIWDHAAGMIVVQEAGGTVTDVTGKALDFTHGRTLEANRGIIATAGRIHDPVVKAVGQALNQSSNLGADQA